LFGCGREFMALDLVFVEDGREEIDYDPWERSAEIDDFVHNKRHDSCCEDIILHVGIPSSP
jgi:hypothetical protein